MKKLINNSTLFELTSKLTFGRYKGKILRNIIKKDPDYIAWCFDNIKWFDLHTEADEFLQQNLIDDDWVLTNF